MFFNMRVQQKNRFNVRSLGIMTPLWLWWSLSVMANHFDRSVTTMSLHHGSPPLRGGGVVLKRDRSSRKGGRTDQLSSSSAVVEKSIPPGSAGHTAQVLNLVKTIIGAGVLGLPAGMAASFGTSQTIPRSMFLLILIGWLAAHGFHHVGNVCRVTGSTSYAQAWERTVATPGTTWIPNTACVMVTLGTVLTYSMVLADTIPSLLTPVVQSIGLANLPVTRNGVLWVLTATTILPLCLLQSLKALAPFSLLGICGMVYTAVIMALRSVDGSYAAPNGRFVATLASKCRPTFPANQAGGGAAILVSMLSTAYMAHYNAPSFYWQLKDRDAAKYHAVVFQSFGWAMTLMVLIASTGFSTFGTASQSLILNNYSPHDRLMSLSRWAVVFSLLFSYPLAFGGVRDGIFRVLGVAEEHRTRALSQKYTVAILAVITILASIMKDIRVVLSFNGATWGTLLSYVFPAFMVVGLSKRSKQLDAYPSPSQVRFAVATAIVGVAMGVIGTMKAIQALSSS